MTPSPEALAHTALNLRMLADTYRCDGWPTLARLVDAAADEAQALSGQPVLPGIVREMVEVVR